MTAPGSQTDNPALFAAKLRGLVVENFDAPDLDVSTLTGAAAGSSRGAGYFLAGTQPDRAVGQALAWATSRGLESLHVIADPGGVAARRAALFDEPPTVWESEGRAVRPAEPAAWLEPAEVPPTVRELAAVLQDAGLEVVVEHGAVTGEVAGLEVAKVVDDVDGPRIEVGVGRHDRDAFAQMHGEMVTSDALSMAGESARRHRSAEADGSHPLSRLAPERWLRSKLIAAPGVVGAATLQPVALAVERDSVKDRLPAAAAGLGGDDRPLVVVASVGVDLDLVPVAGEVVEYLAGADGLDDPRLVIVLPERDVLPLVRTLADRLTRPAELVTVPDDWRRIEF